MIKLIPKLIDENASLRDIIAQLTTGGYDIKDNKNLRITSDLKPGCIVLYALSAVDEAIFNFLETNPFDNQTDKKDISFETEVEDFIVLNIISEGTKKTITTISLLELLAMDSVVQSTEKVSWSIDSKEFKVVEMVNPLEVETEIPTDMHLFG